MTIGPRLLSALLLTAVTGMLYWLTPNLSAEMVGADTPERAALFFGVMFAIFWLYLVLQGYAVAHGDIGSSSTHNLDNIVSGLPAISALFGIFLHVIGFWRVSVVNLILGGMTLA